MGVVTKCRFCKSGKLLPYLDLGFTPLADRFLTKEQLKEPEIYYPLVVVLCDNCGLNQLTYTVPPQKLYQENYPYTMSLTKIGRDHYFRFAESVAGKLNLGRQDLVVDIGGNIGVLLEGFKKYGTKILNIDPAKNIAAIANKRGIRTIANFFTPKAAEYAIKKFGKAKLVVGTNVFAHVFDHFEFVKALKILLRPDGVFVFESPHFLNLVKNLEYDTIYHEHLLYLSLKPVINFFKRHGMDIFDVEMYPIHGGSFRVFIARRGTRQIQPVVKTVLAKEEKAGIHSLPKQKRFAKKVYEHRYQLTGFLNDLKREGKSVAALSTPAKGMTLLNFCRLGPEDLDFATEKSELKIGRFTPGTHIPIFPDRDLLKKQPDYALILAWNFAKEIMKNMEDYKKGGGKFIIPIPKPRII